MAEAEAFPSPLIVPLGDRSLLVRFSTTLSDEANRAAIEFSRRLGDRLPDGVSEFDPNLVSVLLKYDPERTDFDRLAGEMRLVISAPERAANVAAATYHIQVRFGGEDGPDLDAAASALNMTPEAFVAAHNASALRVLTIGFAPGFAYCGFHPEAFRLPRRTEVRPPMPPGSVLFAAGQTAITSTSIPTGWHVIGRTDFRNFDPAADPPTTLREGDIVIFEAAPS